MTIPTLPVVSEATMIARLTPMKRILCLCPVQTSTPKENVAVQVGMALSDPYLARASPLGQWKIQGPLSNPHDTFPSNISEWKKELEEYPDIGAIAIAMPMRVEESQLQTDTLLWKNYILQEILQKRYLSEDPHFSGNGLVCEINHQLSWTQAKKLAEEDPDMWEEMDLETKENQIQPAVHAYVALNHFLWQHTGGWQNTFG